MSFTTSSPPTRSTAPDVIVRPGSNGAAAATGTETPPTKRDTHRTYTCPQCELVLRVTGIGRHQVFFPLTDERLDDPVMDRVCPGCGHGLPRK